MTTSGENRAARTDGGDVVRQSGIEAGKSYETDRFPVPAISLTIRSEREDPVTVRLADRVPEDVSMDDVGFHPEYGSEFWSVDGHTLVFERELEPEAEIETVYGLRGPESDEPERFLGEPTIEVRTGDDNGSVSEGGGGGGVLDDVNEPLVRSATFEDDSDEDATAEEDLTADDPEAEDASEDTDAEAGSEEEARNEVIEENAGERSDDTEENRDSETGKAGESDGPGATVAGAAASTAGSNESETGRNRGTATGDEIMNEEGRPDIERIEEENAATNTEAGTLPDEEAPNPAADADRDPPDESASSTGGGSDVDGGDIDDDIDGGVEEGVDTEDGLAAALARELRAGRIDSEDRETLREVLGPRDSVAVRIDRLGSRVEELTAYADALEAFIDENGSARKLVRRQSERIDVLDEDVERTDGYFESVEGNFEEVEERFEHVESRLDAIDERLDAIEATQESDRKELREDLESQVDERIADTERSVESVAADVEALESWRAQLSAVVGGAGETGGTNDEGTTGTETDSE